MENNRCHALHLVEAALQALVVLGLMPIPGIPTEITKVVLSPTKYEL